MAVAKAQASSAKALNQRNQHGISGCGIEGDISASGVATIWRIMAWLAQLKQ